MIQPILKLIDRISPIPTARAHCDIPCKIYDPITAQISALTVIRMLDLMDELGSVDTLEKQAKLARLVSQKEQHAAQVKEEIRIIWGDYFKEPQFAQFPDTHALVHKIMLAGSKARQGVSRDDAVELLNLVNEFAASFWETKGVSTFTATCPYPPSESVVYPKLGS